MSKLVSNLAKENSKVDCVLLTSLPNLKYYFNYSGASFERFCGGLISIKDWKSALVVPKLDEGKTVSSSSDDVFAWTDSEGYGNSLAEALKGIGLGKSKSFACEDWITLYLMEAVRKVRAGARFESISKTISKQRLIKEDEEIQAMKISTSKLAKGYEKLPGMLRAGLSEIEAAFEIKKTLGDLGISEVDFCAVQSGPNSSVPHSQTSGRKLTTGDMIVVDISCVDESGYFADFTRTFAVGSVTDEQMKVYETVKEAQAKGVEIARPNIAAKVIDKEVRSVIEKAGFGQYFIHRTGHGLGLEVHEEPYIASENSSKLRAGMTFTIEPGAYLPGKFGVRIEDNVVLTSSGNENLTKVTHDIIKV
jgi:Xaa-Pro aminopeptidase